MRLSAREKALLVAFCMLAISNVAWVAKATTTADRARAQYICASQAKSFLLRGDTPAHAEALEHALQAYWTGSCVDQNPTLIIELNK